MPNRTPDTGQSQKQRTPPPTPGEDKSEQDVRDMSRRQDEPDVDETDNVEIGDPVPEDDRTVRAGGETGEDEDLPADDGNIEKH